MIYIQHVSEAAVRHFFAMPQVLCVASLGIAIARWHHQRDDDRKGYLNVTEVNIYKKTIHFNIYTFWRLTWYTTSTCAGSFSWKDVFFEIYWFKISKAVVNDLRQDGFYNTSARQVWCYQTTHRLGQDFGTNDSSMVGMEGAAFFRWSWSSRWVDVFFCLWRYLGQGDFCYSLDPHDYF